MDERAERPLHYLGAEPPAWYRGTHRPSPETEDILALHERVERLENALLAESVKTPEIRELEIGDAVCAIVCQKLRAILDTGEHHGTFGGEELEALAQAILAQRSAVERVERERGEARAEAARFREALKEITRIYLEEIGMTQKDYYEIARDALRAGSAAPRPQEEVEMCAVEAAYDVLEVRGWDDDDLRNHIARIIHDAIREAAQGVAAPPPTQEDTNGR